MTTKRYDDWVVYENECGAIYEIRDPRDVILALSEARLCGLGHHARRRKEAEDLRNAFAAGRVYGHRQARQQRERNVSLLLALAEGGNTDG